jgi:formamidopyrimidine-DNA glycosylase
VPELPEVETVVRAMRAVLLGRSIRAIEIRHKPTVSGSPQPLKILQGHTVTAVERRAKFIRIDLDGGLAMAIHLRMTGWLGVQARSHRDPKMDPYIRVVFELDGGNDNLVFRDIRTFGRIWVGTREQITGMREISKLGPEPLEISAADFATRLRERGGRLKALLLNQEFLAGIGNIYADESLFSAGLHPLGSARKVSVARAEKLHGAIQEILQRAIAAGGSSVVDFVRPDGEKGWFQRELQAYGREGEPCVRCATPIRRIVVGQRGTWFCAKCQKK